MDGIKRKYTFFWQILLNNLRGRLLFSSSESFRGTGRLFLSAWVFRPYLVGICLALFFSELEGYTPHVEKPQQIPSLQAPYRLIDLGPIDADLKTLSRFEGHSLFPAINNDGDVMANTKEGGIFFWGNESRYDPRIKGAKIAFHALNNHGDVLAAIHRERQGTDWVIWPIRDQGRSHTVGLDTANFQGSDLSLSLLNDARWVAGAAYPDDSFRPIFWTPAQGLFQLGFVKGLDSKGVVRQINERGMILGQKRTGVEHPPFLWDADHGVIVLEKYRSEFQPELQGRIVFSDLAFSDEGIVYGTYWINDTGNDSASTLTTPHHSFVWLPYSRQFFLTNIGGMRIAQLNNSLQIAGYYKGKAAMRERGKMPVPIQELVSVEDFNGWEELIEATGINDSGQIVGFGTKEGEMHLFRADPLPNK